MTESTDGSGAPGRPIRGVILDVDGTLLLSNDAHAAAWTDTLVAAGHDVTADRVRPLIGMGGDKLLADLRAPSADSPEGERLGAEARERFARDHLPTLRPTPGARALLERLRADGLRLVVATSAERGQLEGLLRQAGVDDLVDEATSNSDVESSKPDPDIVMAAVRRSGLPPESLVMIGDTPYDVAAAMGAGVPIVAVRCGGWTDETLRGAVAVYDDPADLLAHYDRSIFGRDARPDGER
jgi:HAD superfamily hydrolase (TIGR01509 family)